MKESSNPLSLQQPRKCLVKLKGCYERMKEVARRSSSTFHEEKFANELTKGVSDRLLSRYLTGLSGTLGCDIVHRL
jgi:hypothetical protein